MEAREKAKLGLSDEPGTPDEPVALLEETTGDEDRASEVLEIPRPATYVPAEVQPDIATTAQSGVPGSPPRPVANDEPVLGTGTVNVTSTVKQLPLPGSATKFEAPADENSASEAEKVKKRQNVLNRVFWSLVMIGGFIGMSQSLLPAGMIKLLQSPLASWTCVHDSTRHAVSGTCLQGSHRPILLEVATHRRP